MNIFGLLCRCSMFNCQLSFAEKTKPRRALRLLGVFIPGNDLVSHKVALAVPSAQRGLTSVFGMGTGVALSIQSPETFYNAGLWIADGGCENDEIEICSSQPPSAIRYPTSTNFRSLTTQY